MKQEIPDTLKLFKFATKSLVFSQVYQIRDFYRISTLVSNIEAPVEVELSFGFVSNKIPYIKGDIKLEVKLPCQRCLQAVSLHLKPRFKLAFLQNEQQGEGIDSGFETILNTHEEFSSIDFITDEILIEIPMIPMHNHNCGFYKDLPPIDGQKRENPFAILKNIKNKE